MMADYTFREYAEKRLAAQQGEPDEWNKRLTLGALGLAGEAGEVCEIVKKHFFHGKELNRDALLRELGDVLWYVMFSADALGSSLEHVAKLNDAKLAARYPNGFSVEAAQSRPSDREPIVLARNEVRDGKV